MFLHAPVAKVKLDAAPIYFSVRNSAGEVIEEYLILVTEGGNSQSCTLVRPGDYLGKNTTSGVWVIAPDVGVESFTSIEDCVRAVTRRNGVRGIPSVGLYISFVPNLEKGLWEVHDNVGGDYDLVVVVGAESVFSSEGLKSYLRI